MPIPSNGEYWNHNTAYHPRLIDIAAQHRGDVLDVGCGDGLLAHRLAPMSRSVTGIDPDRAAIQQAADRLAAHKHVTVSREAFDSYQPGRQFDLITFVASLHHMDLQASLVKAREMLAPRGEIAVVGLSANKTVRDWLWSAIRVPLAWLGSQLHSETRNVGVVVTDPREGLDDIRRIVDVSCLGRRYDGPSTAATYCAGPTARHRNHLRHFGFRGNKSAACR